MTQDSNVVFAAPAMSKLCLTAAPAPVDCLDEELRHRSHSFSLAATHRLVKHPLRRETASTSQE
ncbi:hypothetical protein [Rhizobium binxianense]